MMRNIIIKNNEFLNNMVIVLIFGVNSKEDEKVYDILSKMACFTGMEKTQKQEEGKYLLINTVKKILRSERCR